MAFDAFLKIDGIDGESTDKTHPREIPIDSFSWGVSNPATIGSSGGGAGKASVSSLNFLAPASKAGPNLFLACATGKHIASAVLTCRKAGGVGGSTEFIKIRLIDVLVESWQQSGSASANSPEDSFSLFFVKIDFTYTVASTGETVEVFYDQTLATAG